MEQTQRIHDGVQVGLVMHGWKRQKVEAPIVVTVPHHSIEAYQRRQGWQQRPRREDG